MKKREGHDLGEADDTNKEKDDAGNVIIGGYLGPSREEGVLDTDLNDRGSPGKGRREGCHSGLFG